MSGTLPSRNIKTFKVSDAFPETIQTVFGLTRNRNRVAALGDSQTNRNHRIAAGSAYNTSTNGYLVVLNGLLGGRMRWSQKDNYGVVGDRMVQAEVRVPQVIASDVGTCFLHIFTNDCLYIARYASSTPAILSAAFEEAKASFLRSVDAMRAAGILMFLMPPQQRTTAAWITNFGLTSDQVPIARRLTAAFREVMIQAARVRREVVLLDPTAVFGDVGGGPRTNYTDDGTHYRDLGTFAMAKFMAPIVGNYIPRTSVPAVDLSDTYDAAQFPRGNLLANALMAGANVAVNTAPLTGNTVNSWGAQVSNGGTVTGGTAVLSPVTRPDGLGQGLRLVVSGLAGSSANALLGIGQTVTTDDMRIVAGDVLEGAVAIDVNSAGAGFRGVQMRPVENDGSGTGVDVAAPELPYGGFSTDAASYVWNSAQFPIRPANGAGARSTIVRLLVSLDTTVSGGASCDVTFWAPDLRKVL